MNELDLTLFVHDDGRNGQLPFAVPYTESFGGFAFRSGNDGESNIESLLGFLLTLPIPLA